ncbi:T7SS effector LXG polymorphic toxin [Listeria booriae]|uniref:T7SS effector LXG polymorphic toxin n=1 Tax=Listeria booriae TaxID=1552123 RepID=UPI00288070E6|nr:T7SS effector LXG polymorphic toxin [Listeria booriae]MDT0108914.1 T7SS effector LXG polymorphic toxin [Listeria booriae]
MPRLVNDELKEISTQLKSFKEKITEALYEQYKTSTVLSETINLRGTSGDAYKSYMAATHLHLIKKLINVIQEINDASTKIQKDFLGLEKDQNGIVGSGTIDDKVTKLNTSHQNFDTLDGTANNILNRAKEYISVSKLNQSEISSSFTTTDRELKKIITDLENMDNSSNSGLSGLQSRLLSLKNEINDISKNFRDKNGIISSKVNGIKSEEWYGDEDKGLFKEMSEDDPFTYAASEGSLAQEQWVAGAGSDIYGAATATGLGYNASFSMDNKSISGNVEGNVFKLQADGQLTEYVNANGAFVLAHGAADFTIDTNGLAAKADVAMVKADGSLVVGVEDYNLFLNGEASALTADAGITLTKSEIGASAHASLAEAEAKGGFEVFGVEVGAGVSAGIGVGGEFAVGINRLKIEAKLLLGFDIDIKFPW